MGKRKEKQRKEKKSNEFVRKVMSTYVTEQGNEIEFEMVCIY
jgi:hypothetical protein